VTLAEFNAAPESVKREFEEKLAAEVAHDREQARWEAVDGEWHPGDDNFSPFNPRRRPPETEWNDRWRRKAKRHLQPVADNRAELEALDLREAWESLTGEEVPHHGMVACPSPDHEDRNPSCSVRDERWRCFACGATGTVIDLAAIVFDVEPYGAGFFEVRKRLLEAA
jgi:hypothetical protein